MTPEAKKHLDTATHAMQAAVEAAFEAGKRTGIEIGVEQERVRVKKALFSEEAETPVEERPDQATVQRAVAAGSLINMARLMLAKDRKRSFSILDAVEYFAEHYHAPVDADQMRSLLKVLTRQNEAHRLERGIYIAGPSLEAPTTLLGAA